MSKLEKKERRKRLWRRRRRRRRIQEKKARNEWLDLSLSGRKFIFFHCLNRISPWMKQIYCAMTNILLCTAQKNAREKKTETNLRVKNYFVKISTFGWYYSMLYSDEHSHQMNIFGHVLLYGMGGWVWVSVFLFIAVDIRRVWLKHKTLNKFLAIYQEPSHCAHRSSVHQYLCI